ncbi:unnamed protein product [Cylicocyclus nassatus]|uniref:Uncharacterized protein n=1 Tax=Cylicocyclus nassatus TaxID=53992 RepID=A0AA36GU42_CYLNA|nr:unnamed protein product [Cylicocyclus nassatus]
MARNKWHADVAYAAFFYNIYTRNGEKLSRGPGYVGVPLGCQQVKPAPYMIGATIRKDRDSQEVYLQVTDCSVVANWSVEIEDSFRKIFVPNGAEW